MQVANNAALIQQRAQTWAKAQNTSLEALNPTERQQVIKDVAADTKIPAAQVREALFAVWTKTNEDQGRGLEKAGGAWAYQGGADQRSVGNSALGAVMNMRIASNQAKGGLSGDENKVLKDGMITAGADGKFAMTDAGTKLRDGLVAAAKTALAAPTFDARNQGHADAVGKEGALLAAHALGMSMDLLGPLFKDAAVKAGEAFKGAFTASGEKIPEQEKDVFKPAMSAAGGIAYEALKTLDKNAGKIVDRANINDLTKIVAGQLGYETKLSGEAVKDLITGMKDTLLKDDYFKDKIDIIPLSLSSMTGGKDLNDKELGTLELGIRLANTTWKSGQVHRAAWEGNDGRVNPEVRTAYNPFDQLKGQMFNETFAALTKDGMPPAQAKDMAFARVVFEIYKDLDQIEGARAKERPMPSDVASLAAL
jgi:hypothetical protein